jgi:two-component system, LytTR family, sensor kinase
LKMTLNEHVQQEISLEQELKFINQYLEIEKVRYEDKLKILQDIDRDSLQAAVPSFLLLPLVENSVYHAIAPKVSGGVLKISSSVHGEELLITVEDNGPGLEGFSAAKKTHNGVGIKITKERLFYSFGERFTIHFSNSTLGGLKVNIKIPFKHIDWADQGSMISESALADN